MIVYKATNKVNGKSYIGKTIYLLDERIEQHISHVKGGSNTYFHRALRKYDFDSFTWTILEELNCIKNNEHDLNEKEVYWIAKLNTFRGDGYNMTEGGDGLTSESAKILVNRPHVRKNISIATKKALAKPDVKNRQCEANREINNRPEVKENHSRRTKKQWENPETKAIMSALIKASINRPEAKEKRAKSLRRRWSVPGAREKHGEIAREVAKRPEVRKHRSEAVCGEKNPYSKLTDSQRRQIHIERSQGVPVRGLAKKYSMTEGGIYYILQDKRWEV